MQVFKTFFKLLNQIKGQVIMYFCIFVGISSIVAANVGKTSVNTYEKEKIKVAVMDQDQSELSKGITNYVKKNHTLVKVKNDKEAIADALYWRDVQYIIEIPKGFGEAVANKENADLSTRKMEETKESAFMDQDLSQYVSMVNSYINCGYSVKDALGKSEDSLSHKATVNIATEDQNKAAEKSKESYYFLYVPFALISIAIMSVSLIMMFFQKEDIKKRCVCSATALRSQNAQINLASFVFMGFIIVGILIAICVSTKGEVLRNDGFLYYVGNVFAFGIVSIAIAFLVGSYVKSEMAVSGACNVFNLGFCFLGGIFVSLEVLPKAVVNVSRFLPTYWYAKNIDEIAYMTSVTDDFLKNYFGYLGIELLFAVLFLSIGLVISKRRTIFG